ncbi:unnamed protein product [Ixodes hexagonus]
MTQCFWSVLVCFLLAISCGSLRVGAADSSIPEYIFQDLCDDSDLGTNGTSIALTKGSAALIQLNNSRTINCTVRVRFPKDYGVLVTIVELSMRSSLNCSEDFFRVRAFDKDQESLSQRFCGNHSDVRETNVDLQTLVPAAASAAGSLLLEVYASNVTSTTLVPRLTAVLTTYTNGDVQRKSCPNSHQHLCYNWRCISRDFFCDGHNHCGGNRRPSELQCPGRPVSRRATLWGLATIGFGVVSTILLLPFFVWTAVRGGQLQVTSIIQPGTAKDPRLVPTPALPSINESTEVGDDSVVCEIPQQTTSDTARLVSS